MTTVNQVMKSLKAKGSEQTRKIFARHGAASDKLYGVKVADMKVIAKTIKGEQDLALDLYETGNYDAMYLAGMVADGRQMTKTQLQAWARQATWQMIAEYTVPWVAAESDHGRALAMKWIGMKAEHVAAAGWNTYSGLVTTTDDADLDLDEIEGLLERIEEQIDDAPNRVRYCMNGFVIGVGSPTSSRSLKQAKATAKKPGEGRGRHGGDGLQGARWRLDYIAKVEKDGIASARSARRSAADRDAPCRRVADRAQDDLFGRPPRDQ